MLLTTKKSIMQYLSADRHNWFPLNQLIRIGYVDAKNSGVDICSKSFHENLFMDVLVLWEEKLF